MIGRRATIAAALLAPIAGRASAQPACVGLAALVAPAAFARYPAAVGVRAWRGPDVRSGRAHRYRTVLRERVSGPPDFAGHYSVVWIGCGAGLTCPAIVDRVTGSVSFPAAIRSVYFLPADTGPAGAPDRLAFRADSRLLVVLGARDEIDRTSGVTRFDWRGGRLKPIGFTPEPRLCRNGGAYR